MSNSRMDPMDPEYVPVISKRSAPSQAPAQDFSAQPALSSGHYIYNNESQSSNGASNSTGVALPESVFAVKKIPQSSWVIAFTTLDHEFFFNTRTNTSVWEMPDEIAETITTLMSGGEVPEDENEENERDGGKKRDHPEFDETFEIFKKQKVDESALEMTHAEKFQGFIDLLRDTDVNPFSTWEKELPKFVSDVRYTRITHKDRKKAFDEYCRIRSNEIKEEKKSKVKDNRALFLKLLESSTTFRSTFDEFSRKHKKDASFLGLEPRERESLFKEHIAKLREMETEKKRKEIERAKKDFFSLLSELKWINSESEWRKVKRDIEHDKRYQAVQQMTERENIFKEYLQSLKVIDEKERARMEEERKVKARKERENASLREREERVRQEREIQNRHLDSTRSRVLRDEAEDLLKALLVDVVKSHDSKFNDKRQAMERDPRWRQISSALQLGDIQSIFELHCHSILEKRLNLFRELVERSCSPIESFDNIWILIKDDSRVTKLLSPSQESETSEPSNGLLRRDFDRFQKERIRKANAGLEECLRENKFLQFHVRNAVQTTESAEKEGTKEAKDEDEDEEGAIAMDKVWKLINLEEIQTVLTDDKRWLEYRYFPEEREKMLKDYVTSLVESIKAEKGGTVDLTIALHAGGVINEKKHKPPKEHCDEQDSYGKRYKRDDRDRSPKRSGGSFANERRERMRYD